MGTLLQSNSLGSFTRSRKSGRRCQLKNVGNVLMMWKSVSVQERPLGLFTGDRRLHLDSAELENVGEFTQLLAEGRHEYYEKGTKSILDGLGFKGVSEAKDLMRRLGRMQFCVPR